MPAHDRRDHEEEKQRKEQERADAADQTHHRQPRPLRLSDRHDLRAQLLLRRQHRRHRPRARRKHLANAPPLRPPGAPAKIRSGHLATGDFRQKLGLGDGPLLHSIDGKMIHGDSGDGCVWETPPCSQREEPDAIPFSASPAQSLRRAVGWHHQATKSSTKAHEQPIRPPDEFVGAQARCAIAQVRSSAGFQPAFRSRLEVCATTAHHAHLLPRKPRLAPPFRSLICRGAVLLRPFPATQGS
ncbi:MAG: hypothetical protein BWX86_02238 [Verrucomicrobia bacterium ADurb.Bin122]|nr:MAG: hypothetical protein BWX86_02238 [Verrucomicrobia bacterium ADurb.Bin122]